MGRDLRFHLETTDEDEPYVAISGNAGTVLMLVPNHNIRQWVAACGPLASHIRPAEDLTAIIDNTAAMLGLTTAHHALHRVGQGGRDVT